MYMVDQFNMDEIPAIERGIDALDSVIPQITKIVELAQQVAEQVGSKKLKDNADKLEELKPSIDKSVDSLSGTSTDGEGGFAGLTFRGYIKSAKATDELLNG